MLITIGRSRVDVAQEERIQGFLADLLPRVEQQDGVVAAYHYRDTYTGESTTVIVWRDAAAAEAYRGTDLIAEAVAFEQAEGLRLERGTFELSYPTS